MNKPEAAENFPGALLPAPARNRPIFTFLLFLRYKPEPARSIKNSHPPEAAENFPGALLPAPARNRPPFTFLLYLFIFGFIFVSLSCARNSGQYKSMWDLIDSSLYRSRLFYPRRAPKITPEGARDFDIPVGDGIILGARWFIEKEQRPTVLFFHGNGETVPDYDDMSVFYHQIGLNLFVVDFRGYGWSTGEPRFRTMQSDAEKVLNFFLEQLKDGPRPIIMGRSLGSGSATYLAVNFPDKFRFLILESAFGDVVPLFRIFGLDASKFKEEIENEISNRRRLTKVNIPVLFIHGEEDEFFPLATLKRNFEAVPHERKKKLILDGAGHNTLLLQRDKYFAGISEFIREH